MRVRALTAWVKSRYVESYYTMELPPLARPMSVRLKYQYRYVCET